MKYINRWCDDIITDDTTVALIDSQYASIFDYEYDFILNMISSNCKSIKFCKLKDIDNQPELKGLDYIVDFISSGSSCIGYLYICDKPNLLVRSYRHERAYAENYDALFQNNFHELVEESMENQFEEFSEILEFGRDPFYYKDVNREHISIKKPNGIHVNRGYEGYGNNFISTICLDISQPICKFIESKIYSDKIVIYCNQTLFDLGLIKSFEIGINNNFTKGKSF